MMQNLKGKKILFFSPKFFGYEFEIKKELESLGAKVFYFDERPKNDFFTKVCIRLNFKAMIQKKIDSYYENIITNTKKEEFDYLFLVDTETIDTKTIETIKNLHKNIKIYTYMWDSIKNRKKSLSLLLHSDKFFTFDRRDIEIDKKINFLPLFYINDYKNIAEDKNDIQYDFSFIGTIHSDRYKIIKKFEEFAKENNANIFYYFYSPSKVLFFFQKLLKKDFRTIDKNDISFSSLSKEKVINIIKQSKIIIDIHHPMQSGLTMRTIEILGAKRKLITTNHHIKEYDFYNPSNIFIVDRESLQLEKKFIETNYEPIGEKIYEKYSLESWIKNIFTETEKK